MSVIIGYNHSDKVDADFVSSLVNIALSGDVAGVLSVESSAFLVAGRNDLAKTFMEATDADYLLQVDADMQLPRDIVPRLLKVATSNSIVGGLCFMLNQNRVLPVMFDKAGGMILEWTPGSLVEVGSTGGACLLIPRTVLEKVAYPWFTQDPDGVIDQDQRFLYKAQEAGVNVFVDTSMVIGHIKRRVITVFDYIDQLEAASIDQGTIDS